VWARTTRNKYLALASAALAIGYVIAHALLLDRFPWFVDETYFAWLAQAVQGDPAQRFAALSDHKGLVISWIAAFLIHFDVPPVTAMRLISIVSGAVAVVATGYIVWRWKRSQWLALTTAAGSVLPKAGPLHLSATNPSEGEPGRGAGPQPPRGH
jgi:hypothetical protein